MRHLLLIPALFFALILALVALVAASIGAAPFAQRVRDFADAFLGGFADDIIGSFALMATRRDLEIISHARALPLALGAPNTIGKDFPLGEGWYQLMLRFSIDLTVGTGTTPIAEGELSIIKDIGLRTSAGEVLCKLPARALYKIATLRAGTPPRKDAIAAATAVYTVDLPVYFVDDLLKRPEDTILDTSRYSGIALDITVGGVADLLGVVGTAVVNSVKVDLEIERTKGRLPKKGLPMFHCAYLAMQSQDASVQTFIDIDRSPDIAYKRFLAHASANGVAGGIFTGANADDVQSIESFVDQSGDIVRERIHEMIQNHNKRTFSLETVLAGVTAFDVTRDGSINTALYPGDRSRLQYKWTNKAGVAAGDVVSLVAEAIRGLKQ